MAMYVLVDVKCTQKKWKPALLYMVGRVDELCGIDVYMCD